MVAYGTLVLNDGTEILFELNEDYRVLVASMTVLKTRSRISRES